MRTTCHQARAKVSGFSMTELLVVLCVVGVMSVIALPYLVNFKKAYKSEDQALKVIDLMRESSQLALNRRRTIRFEIDYTDNMAQIIDENNNAPDTLIKRIPLEFTREVRMDIAPAGVTRPTPPNYADAVVAPDTRGYVGQGPSASAHMVWVARFRSDGSVVNNVDIPLSATLYSWPPISPGSTTPRTKNEVRAITIFGGSGAIRYWKHNGTSFLANQ